MKEIAKRYLIEQFSSIKTEKNEEFTFNLFETITDNDVKAMHNEKGNFTELEIVEQFKKIKERFSKKEMIELANQN